MIDSNIYHYKWKKEIINNFVKYPLICETSSIRMKIKNNMITYNKIINKIKNNYIFKFHKEIISNIFTLTHLFPLTRDIDDTECSEFRDATEEFVVRANLKTFAESKFRKTNTNLY